MTPRYRLQSCREVSEGLDFVYLGRLDEGRDDTPGFAALVVASKESIFAV